MEQNNIEAMKILIDAGADIESRDHFNKTPLRDAVDRDNIGAIKILVDAGADPGAEDTWGRTPFEISLKNTRMFNILMAAQGNLNEGHKNIKFPIHAAARFRVEEMNDILDAGADIDAQNESGMTPLHCAADDCNSTMIEFLLERNANIHIRDIHDRTPFDIAIKTGRNKSGKNSV